MAKPNQFISSLFSSAGLKKSLLGKAFTGVAATSGTSVGAGITQISVLSELQKQTRLLDTINRTIMTQAALTRQAMTGYTPPSRTISGGTGPTGGANPMSGAGAEGSLAAAGPAGLAAAAIVKVASVIKDGLATAIKSADPSGGSAMSKSLEISFGMVGAFFTPMIVIAGAAAMTLAQKLSDELQPSAERLAKALAVTASIAENAIEKAPGAATGKYGLIGIERAIIEKFPEFQYMNPIGQGKLLGSAIPWIFEMIGSEGRQRQPLASHTQYQQPFDAKNPPAAGDKSAISIFAGHMQNMIGHMKVAMAEKSGPPQFTAIGDFWKQIQMSTFKSPLENLQTQVYGQAIKMMDMMMAAYMNDKKLPGPLAVEK